MSLFSFFFFFYEGYRNEQGQWTFAKEWTREEGATTVDERDRNGKKKITLGKKTDDITKNRYIRHFCRREERWAGRDGDVIFTERLYVTEN